LDLGAFFEQVEAVVTGTLPLDLTIVTFSVLGWRTVTRLQRKLGPIIDLLEKMTPEQIEMAREKIAHYLGVEIKFKREGL
jgi:hypothetical protein